MGEGAALCKLLSSQTFYHLIAARNLSAENDLTTTDFREH